MAKRKTEKPELPKFEPEFETIKKKNTTRIVNADCPFGYTYCYEKKPARDKRYCQEWTCSWLFGSKGRIEWICLEMGKM